MYRIVRETGSASEVHFPLAFYLDREVKGVREAKFKFVIIRKRRIKFMTRRKGRDEMKQSKLERLADHDAASAVSESCLVQRLRSIWMISLKVILREWHTRAYLCQCVDCHLIHTATIFSCLCVASLYKPCTLFEQGSGASWVPSWGGKGAAP